MTRPLSATLAIALCVVAAACARTPKLDRQKADHLLRTSPGIGTATVPKAGFEGLAPGDPPPMRLLVSVDEITHDPGRRTARARFRWKWSAGSAATYRSTARFRHYEGGWGIEDDEALLRELGRATRVD